VLFGDMHFLFGDVQVIFCELPELSGELLPENKESGYFSRIAAPVHAPSGQTAYTFLVLQ
jgi:hypothetical protein